MAARSNSSCYSVLHTAGIRKVHSNGNLFPMYFRCRFPITSLCFSFQYENFYHHNFNGRKLTWLHHLCHGELKTTYLNKEYIIIMQTYQMAMLLLFESVNQMTCKEMQVRFNILTKINISSIQRALKWFFFSNSRKHFNWTRTLSKNICKVCLSRS